MRIDAAGLLALVAATHACSSALSLEPLDSADSIEVFARVRGDRVLELYRLGSPFAVELGTEDRLVHVRVDERDLVDSRGEPLSSDALPVFRLGTSPRPPGSCGRCLVPSLEAPSTVFAGDDCPVPGHAKLSVYGVVDGELAAADLEDAAAFREAVRLDSSGPCACPAPMTHPPVSQLEVHPLRPDEPYGFFASAPAEDGSVVGFGVGKTVLIRPGGEKFEADSSIRSTGLGLSIPSAPNVTRFVLAGGFSDVTEKTTIELVELEGSRFTNQVIAEVSALVHTMEFARGRLWLGGGVRVDTTSSNSPVVASCDLEGHCEEARLGAPCGRGRVIALDALHDLAVGERSLIRRIDGVWGCAEPWPISIPTPEGEVMIDTVSHALVHGRELLACADSNLVSTPGSTLFRLSLDTGVIEGLAFFGHRSQCIYFAELDSERVALVYFSDSTRKALAVGPLGIEEHWKSIGYGPPPTLVPEVGRPVVTLSALHGNWVMQTSDLALYRRDPNGGVSRAYGPSTFERPMSAIGRVADQLVAVTDEEVVQLSASGIVTAAPLLGLRAGEWPRVMTSEASESPFIATYVGTTSSSALRRLDVGAGELGEPLWVDSYPRRIVELGEGRSLILDDSGAIHLLAGGELKRVSRKPGYLSLSASLGVGWAGGPDLLARIVQSHDGVRVEEDWFERLIDRRPADGADPASPLEFKALAARCPDALGAATDQNRLNRFNRDMHLQTVAVEVGGFDLGCGAPEGESRLVLCAREPFEDLEAPVQALLGDAAILLDGFVAPRAEPPLLVPFGEIFAAAELGELWLVGGQGGRLGWVRATSD
ncbi:MAG: hypothetical protein HYV07_20490 [Deltaproteobacteria bacterium]|nr:hypothetical protein [Deltaproteobacteria bacterium]